MKRVWVAIAGLSLLSAFGVRMDHSAANHWAANRDLPMNSDLPANRDLQTNRYMIDLSASTITVTIFQEGLLSRIRPTNAIAVKNFAGRVALGPESETRAAVEVDVEAASFTNVDKEISEVERKEINTVIHEKVLESARFPQITFRGAAIQDLKRKGDKEDFILEGDLTLRAVTRRVAVPMSVRIAGGQLRAIGEGTLKQSDFGITPYAAAFGLIKIRDEVKIAFNVVARLP